MIEIEAHITGKVWKIEKKVGDRVSKDEVIIILESMKMEIPLESPIDGTITEIRVKKEQVVNEREVVVIIE